MGFYKAVRQYGERSRRLKSTLKWRWNRLNRSSRYSFIREAASGSARWIRSIRRFEGSFTRQGICSNAHSELPMESLANLLRLDRVSLTLSTMSFGALGRGYANGMQRSAKA